MFCVIDKNLIHLHSWKLNISEFACLIQASWHFLKWAGPNVPMLSAAGEILNDYFRGFGCLKILPKDITTCQRLGYNSLMWYTGLLVRHGLPNLIVVCTNERTCSLSSAITKLSYMFSHWSRPHLGLAIHAIMRGWVHCTQFQQNSLISGHVFDVNLL